MNSESASTDGQQLPTYNQYKALKQPLKESAAAFVAAAPGSFDALYGGNNELQKRWLRDLGSALHVLCFKLRDPELIIELAEVNLLLTKALDELLLNEPASGPIIEALHKRAECEPSWPTLVRPGDEKFTQVKLAKLGVGNKALGRATSKRSPSHATARNRLARRLYMQIKYCAQAIANRPPRAVRLHLVITALALKLDIPESQHKPLLKILRSIKPLSKETLKLWNRALTNFVILIDPTLEQFPELEKVRSAKNWKYGKIERASFRSELNKFFGPALKNLLS